MKKTPPPSPKENLFAALRNLKSNLKKAKIADAKKKFADLKESPFKSMAMIKKSELVEDTTVKVVEEVLLTGNSCGICGPKNPLRRFTKAIT
jgi:hypothetical protein